MKTFLRATIVAAFTILGLANCSGGSSSTLPLVTASQKTFPPKKTLRAFRSEQELVSYLHELAEKQKREEYRASASLNAAPSPAAKSADSAGASLAAESVTNVQHAGVDEGDIVKVHGNHLVMLRRGRLFRPRRAWATTSVE